jgi:hypothetical protein
MFAAEIRRKRAQGMRSVSRWHLDEGNCQRKLLW